MNDVLVCDYRKPGCTNRGRMVEGVWCCSNHLPKFTTAVSLEPEFKARFLAQQEKKTPEERVTVQRSATVPGYSLVFLDGVQEVAIYDPGRKHGERYAAGLRAELVEKEKR